MLAPTNICMGALGLIYLVAGIFILRKEINAARGWDRFIILACVFIAAPLATFAPEHFRGPEFVQDVVPAWMPARAFWPRFVGCALLAAATSLTLRKFVRLSSTLLGAMFFLFVCMIYLPSALAHPFAPPEARFGWALVLRDLSFAAGAWAIVGLYSRAPAPQLSKAMITFARIALAIAAIFFAAQHFLHPECAPGVPSAKLTPSWVPLPNLWAYLAGGILLAAGMSLILNRQPRIAAASISALMTLLTIFLYVPLLILAHGAAAPEINEALNYVADTLLYAGAALALASALPRDSDRTATS
jgi:uncharacterized membrane protein